MPPQNLKKRQVYLRPEFKNVFERHTCGRQFTLQHHHDIMVVLVNHLGFCRSRCSLSLLVVGLETCYLLVDVGNVLFNDEGEFLRGR